MSPNQECRYLSALSYVSLVTKYLTLLAQDNVVKNIISLIYIILGVSKVLRCGSVNEGFLPAIHVSVCLCGEHVGEPSKNG